MSPDRCRLRRLEEVVRNMSHTGEFIYLAFVNKYDYSPNTFDNFYLQKYRADNCSFVSEINLGSKSSVWEDYAPVLSRPSAIGHGKMWVTDSTHNPSSRLLCVNLETGSITKIHNPLGHIGSNAQVICDVHKDYFYFIHNRASDSSIQEVGLWDKATNSLEKQWSLPTGGHVAQSFPEVIYLGSKGELISSRMIWEETTFTASGALTPIPFSVTIPTRFSIATKNRATIFGAYGDQRVGKRTFDYDGDGLYTSAAPLEVLDMNNYISGNGFVSGNQIGTDGSHLFFNANFSGPTRSSLFKIELGAFSLVASSTKLVGAIEERQGVMGIEWE